MYNVNLTTEDKDFAKMIMNCIGDSLDEFEPEGYTSYSMSNVPDDTNEIEGEELEFGYCPCCGCCEEEFDFSEPFDENGELIEFDFGTAIKIMKQGGKVKRKGWNGKNQYIELASNISYVNADGDIINCEHDAIGNQAIAFVGTSGVQMGWLASQADMLAEDWCIHVDENKKENWDDFCF